jgi:diketogulonate reductase-like aldo/keto reductase
MARSPTLDIGVRHDCGCGFLRDSWFTCAGMEHPTRTLPGGSEMPVLGLGVWQMAEGAETERAVEWALEAGYRLIDTATLYRNERSVGAALRRSGVPREEVFVTTKLPPPHTDAARQLAKSLERLGLEYVDLYLVHWPLPLGNTRVWHGLESLREAGLAREIGVSNFGVSRLEKLLAGAHRAPAVNQVQFSPFRYRRRLLECCRERGVVLEAYSPLARGKGLRDATVVAIAERMERTPAQVMLRWALQHGAVVIPKSSRKERIVSNARVFDFALPDADMRLLDELDRTRGSARARP